MANFSVRFHAARLINVAIYIYIYVAHIRRNERINRVPSYARSGPFRSPGSPPFLPVGLCCVCVCPAVSFILPILNSEFQRVSGRETARSTARTHVRTRVSYVSVRLMFFLSPLSFDGTPTPRIRPYARQMAILSLLPPLSTPPDYSGGRPSV